MNWYNKQLKIAFPKKIEFSEDDIQIIKELIEEGNSLRQVSEAVGVSKGVIERLDAKYQWSQAAKKRINDENAQKIKKLVDEGYNLRQIRDISGMNIYSTNKIIKDYDILTNFRQVERVSEEDLVEIKRLYTEEGLGLTEISNRTGVNTTTIVDNLKRMGVYHRVNAPMKYFTPSKEDIQKIDYWYALPPQGEGRSIHWIAQQFNVGDGAIKRWFRKTGRLIRSREEQVKTRATRDDMALAHLLLWEQRGGLEGYLKSLSIEEAISYLNNFVHRVYNEDPRYAMAIRTKYMNIIDNHTFPDEVPQGTTI